MKRSALWASLLGFVALVATALGINFGLGNSPVLGLDLRGGLSVIYATVEPADDQDLEGVRDLMRDQLEDFGIAEPDVRVEGANVIVDLPGVSDQEAAFEALQVSGIVTLRPVIQCQFGSLDDPEADPAAPGVTLAPEDVPDLTGEDEQGLGAPAGRSLPMPAAPPSTDPATSESDDTAEPPTTEPPTTEPVTSEPEVVLPEPAPTTPDGTELLPYPIDDQVCLVGPAGGTGEVFARGSASPNISSQTGQWVVNVDLRADGQVLWNSLASQCFNGTSVCPSRQLAIVLDGEIQSAPTVQTPNFPGNVQISGSFTEDEVRSLAQVLNRGAFPVQVEQERVETVSPTAGQDSLDAAIIAGLIGAALMLTFMIFYYRKLSVVIISGLLVWGVTVYSLATFVSQATNFALTLAGATGIIVAIGVTVDTYVVYFERLKDELRHGRTLRNAAPRSFRATWRTILSADLVSLMASLILFWLSVGSVRGFALYLGLTTICDLLVFYFFTRPAVMLLAETRWFDGDESSAGAGRAIGATS